MTLAFWIFVAPCLVVMLAFIARAWVLAQGAGPLRNPFPSPGVFQARVPHAATSGLVHSPHNIKGALKFQPGDGIALARASSGRELRRDPKRSDLPGMVAARSNRRAGPVSFAGGKAESAIPLGALRHLLRPALNPIIARE